jgi:hypothetical protein
LLDAMFKKLRRLGWGRAVFTNAEAIGVGACVGASPRFSAPARSAAQRVRAHELHTRLCKRLKLTANPTDPSSAQRTIDALSPSLS